MKNNFNKILIVGNGGSGKTTLSLKLSSLLNIPTLHLDKIYWTDGWNKNNIIDFENHVRDFMHLDKWIIEGTPMHDIESRIRAADEIIFLDFNRLTCILRLIKRSLRNYFKKDNDFDGPAKYFSFKAIKWVWGFNASKRNIILDLMSKNMRGDLFVITKNNDVKILLSEE